MMELANSLRSRPNVSQVLHNISFDHSARGPEISGYVDASLADGRVMSWLVDVQVEMNGSWHLRGSMRIDPDGQGQREIERFASHVGAGLESLPAALDV